jgi:molybdopterin-guanine dinucleotide biosynthesis protein A
MSKVTGIILAGGVCRRLDYRNKALLKIRDKSIIENTIDALSEVTEEILIITNSFDEFKHLELRMFEDILPGSGSLGGIHTGLHVSETHHNIFVACDMPFVQSSVFKILLDHREDQDVVIPTKHDGYQPTCAIYSKNCIEPIESQIRSGNLKILDFLPRVRVRKIDWDKLPAPYDPNVFFNINSGADYLRAISMEDRYNPASA